MESGKDKRRYARVDKNAMITYSIVPDYKKERRRFIRIKEDDAINFTTIPTYKSTSSLTKDLSIGGIRFFSGHFIPLHSILKLEIKLKFLPRIIYAIARIVWIKEIFDDERYDIGVEFIEINKQDLRLLDHYLSKRL